jgi:nucleotide-binding universal stress UspA family protein
MVVVSRILVATDFGETSARALDFGRMLADACGASLHLLHVIGYAGESPERESRDRLEASARLESLLTDRDRRTRQATTSCETGTIAAEIVRHAATNAIDLIVMGTHRHGPAFQMVRSSIAETVLEEAPCPVLAVKSTETMAARPESAACSVASGTS